MLKPHLASPDVSKQSTPKVGKFGYSKSLAYVRLIIGATKPHVLSRKCLSQTKCTVQWIIPAQKMAYLIKRSNE